MDMSPKGSFLLAAPEPSVAWPIRPCVSMVVKGLRDDHMQPDQSWALTGQREPSLDLGGQPIHPDMLQSCGWACSRAECAGSWCCATLQKSSPGERSALNTA